MSPCRQSRGVHPPAPVIFNPPQVDTDHDAEGEVWDPAALAVRAAASVRER
jgi:hypothetical protein